jgi:hypothetical protein
MEIHEVQQANCVLMSCAWTAKRVGRMHIGRKLMHNYTLINLVNQPMHSDSQLMHTMLRSHEHHTISTKGTARTTNLPQFHLLCPLIPPLKWSCLNYTCAIQTYLEKMCAWTHLPFLSIVALVCTHWEIPQKRINFSVIWLAPVCQYF